MHDRRDGVEEGERIGAGRVADRLGERRRGQRAGGDDRLVPFGGRQAGDFLAHDGDQRMGFDLGRHGRGKTVAVDGKRAAGRNLVGDRRHAMISEPASRISACSTPTALVSASSERKELEQTSSARPVGLVRIGAANGAHFVQDDGNAGLGRLPCGFRAGEAAADDVDGIDAHGLGISPGGGEMQIRGAPLR